MYIGGVESHLMHIAHTLVSTRSTIIVRRESVDTHEHTHILFCAPLKYANGVCDRTHEEIMLFRYKTLFK
jgi:plasmid rolling circle replication initiator protein Rep